MLVLLLGGCGEADSEGDSPPLSTGAAREPCTTIVIDPGHDSEANPDTEPIGPGSKELKVKDGGGTSGVVSGVPEHEVNLAISLKLRDLLEASGRCVTMTREAATGPSMGNVARAQIANEAGAALFLRVHADGSPDPKRRGTWVLYPAPVDGWTDDILPESERAAELIQEQLVEQLESRDLGIDARDDLTGFNWSDVPVVLAEVGFLTNAEEDRLLTDPAYQQRVAQALFDGTEAFLRG